MMVLKFLKIVSFFTFPFLVFCLAIFFYVSGIYALFPWLDTPLHFLGGISIAYMAVLFFRLCEEKDLIKIDNKFISILIVVSIVMLFAVLWELWEFVFGRTFGFGFFAQESLIDTIGDLFMGLCGGLIGGIFSKV